MNLDKTFCVTEKCSESAFCDRHIGRATEWLKKTGREEKAVSTSDFYKEDESCQMYQEAHTMMFPDASNFFADGFKAGADFGKRWEEERVRVLMDSIQKIMKRQNLFLSAEDRGFYMYQIRAISEALKAYQEGK